MNRVWKNKIIYLTFDDGPTPGITPWVLSLLKRYHCKATFFCLGKQAERYPKIIAQIQNDGHTLGIHGYEHLNGWKTSKKIYIENVHRAAQVVSSNLFRPPYGKITLTQWWQLRKHYRIVWWSYLSKDYLIEACNEKFYYQLLKHSCHKSIIVFHDTPKAAPFLTKYLETYLQWLTENKFVCLTI